MKQTENEPDWSNASMTLKTESLSDDPNGNDNDSSSTHHPHPLNMHRMMMVVCVESAALNIEQYCKLQEL